MAKSTMPQVLPQVPDFSVAQAFLHAGSAKDTIGDDIWTNPHPPPLVVSPTAPTVLHRPPAAPDPVTAVPPTPTIGNDATFSNHSSSLSHVPAPMPKNVYPEDATCDANQLGTMDGDTKASHSKPGDTPKIKRCADEKPTHLIESSPTQAASCNDDEPPYSSGALAILIHDQFRSLTSKPSQENVDSSGLPVFNAVLLKSTKTRNWLSLLWPKLFQAPQ